MADEINNEQLLRDEFAERIKDVTLDDLPSLISELMDRDHDYGTICVAMGLAATATAWACNKHKKGGITGFQAGAVFWEFTRAWGSPGIGESGARIVNFDDLLFPQYADKFNTVSADTMERVRKLAGDKLSKSADKAHPDVVAHWQQVVDGYVPFGLRVVA